MHLFHHLLKEEIFLKEEKHFYNKSIQPVKQPGEDRKFFIIHIIFLLINLFILI